MKLLRSFCVFSFVASGVLSRVASAAPTEYLVARVPGAEIRFAVDSPLDQIIGTSEAMSGRASIDPATGTGSARIVVDLSTFKTGISLRDADLRNQFFEVQKYPQAVLTVQRFDKATPNLVVPGQGGTVTAVGSLSLHGVARPVVIPLRIDAGSQGGRTVVWARGKLDVPFADYHIKRPKALFLKLGDTAHVDIELTFLGPAPVAPAPSVAQAAAVPDHPIKPEPLFRPGAFQPVAKVPKKAKKPRFQFAEATPEGKGERLLADASVGGPGNALTCLHCHSVANEEEHGDVNESGFVVPNRTLYDSARRPTLWQGLEPTPGKASSLCVRLFMLNEKGLEPGAEAALDAYLKKITPDNVVPALDYQLLALTRSTGLTNPIGGDRKHGQMLERRYCESCHAVGKIRPPLTVGLYEPGYLVQRVRWNDGKDDQQMPPFYIDRLPDSELRDIVTYLAGEKSKRIFERQYNQPTAAR
ncbi:MAG: YceI family protein [Deltaproteobacteria bacterium]